MASLRAQWVWLARGGALLSAAAFVGCGVTFPGNLPIGDDDPGVIGQAGTGAAGRGGGVAGTVAGRRGTAGRDVGAAGSGATGAAGFGQGGFGPIGGSVAGVGPRPAGTGGWAGHQGVAGNWGWAGHHGVAGTGAWPQDRDRDGWDVNSDCNDLDPSISPGSFDQCCDGIDNDCDGQDGPRGARCRCMSTGDIDNDGDGIPPLKGDCNDLDSSIFPGSSLEQCCDGVDNDCDGRDDPARGVCECTTDWDGDGWPSGPWGSKSDCDDTNPTVFPGATELCDDGLDNDCDGRYDWMDGCVPFDNDGDGFPANLDCNDWNQFVSPGSNEICNNRVDDNCDGVVDNRESCVNDGDGDGYTSDWDCDDSNGSVYPGAFEPCFDGRDSNCNGTSDFEDPVCRNTWDADGDGWTSDTDCNDMVAWINPGVSEVCGDGWDNNCDGLVDPYPYCNDQQIDWDRDGYPWGKDCNDSDSSVFPGSPYERCCDGLDSNCDGVEGPVGSMCDCSAQGDNDGDGYGVGFSEPGRADCNDQDASINPAAREHCTDGKDNNCNGRVDTDDPQCAPIPPD